MEKKFLGALGRIRYLCWASMARPHTLRGAKYNVAVWSVVLLIAVTNVAMNVTLQPSLLWFWLGLNFVLCAFDGAMLKWAIIGLMWRKEQDHAKAVDAEFMRIVGYGQ